MSPTETWRRIEEVFQAALERPSAQRGRFLDEACAGDPELRREVDSLLAADQAAGSFPERAVAAEAALLGGEPGGSLGPYRLLRPLGRGGMGRVYLAVRDDQAYRQQVAVKLLRHGLDGGEIVSRFRQERQILANLEHPYIARLLDGGTTSAGLPYLVMEYVDGEPIDHYCERRGLAVTARLELFRAVCEAVHFAHQNLVVHRDLKPSNILVTASGVPKLLDFGIAKLLDPTRSPLTVVETAAARPMTPEFASPEQVRGDALTTASDVYSLGVLLYVLLSGGPPYRLDAGRSAGEVERIVCEETPAPPSTVSEIGGARLRRRLRGDLDNVVLMAMRKEPRRRYASVDELARDLERHIRGHPVLARRDTLGYRAAKFVRRHRGAVAAAVLMLATAVTSAVVTARQARLATAARLTAEAALGRAENEKRNAEQVLAFVESLFEMADPGVARGRDITARELVETGAERIDTGLADRPEVRARLMSSLGRIHRHLGLYDRAIELHEKALALRRQRPPDAETVADLNDLARAFFERGDRPRAEELFREALELGGEVFAGEHPQLAGSLNGLGVVLQGRGELEAAEPFLRRALAMRRRLHPEAHPDVAESLHNLGSLRYKQGDLAAAESLLRQALTMKRALEGDDHPTVAVTENNLATLYYKRGDYAAAEATYRRVLALRRKLLGDRHPQVASSLTSLATVIYMQERYGEALPFYEEALEIKLEVLDEGHPSVALGLFALGRALHALDRDGEAEPLLRRAVALRRRYQPGDLPALAEPLVTLGRLLTGRGDAAEAEPLLREAVEVLGRRQPEAADARTALGGCLAALGHRAQARELVLASYPILAEALGEDDPRTREARELMERLEADGS